MKTAYQFVRDAIASGCNNASQITMDAMFEEGEVAEGFATKVKFIVNSFPLYCKHREMVRDMIQENISRYLNTKSENAKKLVEEFEIGCYCPHESTNFNGVTIYTVDEYSARAWGERHTFETKEEFEAKVAEIVAFGN